MMNDYSSVVKLFKKGKIERRKAMIDLHQVLSELFKGKLEISDLETPQGLSDLLKAATHWAWSKASVGIEYSALSGEWHIEVGSLVFVESGGPDYGIALASALILYKNSPLPKSVEPFITILSAK